MVRSSCFNFGLFFQSHIKLKFYVHLIMALLVGSLYTGVGNDATKALFNFGFVFTIIIAYLYIPMMPVLLQCKFIEIKDTLRFIPTSNFFQFPAKWNFWNVNTSINGTVSARISLHWSPRSFRTCFFWPPCTWPLSTWCPANLWNSIALLCSF